MPMTGPLLCRYFAMFGGVNLRSKSRPKTPPQRKLVRNGAALEEVSEIQQRNYYQGKDNSNQKCRQCERNWRRLCRHQTTALRTWQCGEWNSVWKNSWAKNPRVRQLLSRSTFSQSISCFGRVANLFQKKQEVREVRYDDCILDV
jgi:hypothetical protein